MKKLIIVLCVILGLAILTLAALLVMESFNEPDPPYERPSFEGQLTVYFYDEDGELLNTYTCEKYKGTKANSEEIFANAPDIKKVGYDFSGWFYSDKDATEIKYDTPIATFEYSSRRSIFNNLMEKLVPENGEVKLYLHALFSQRKFTVRFLKNGTNDGLNTERVTELIYRGDNTNDSQGCTYDKIPRAPGGNEVRGQKEIVGWRTSEDSGSVLVYDFAGNLIITVDELYNLARSYGGNIKQLKLYPVFGEKFSILTFDFLAEELPCEYGKVLLGDTFESVTQPEAYYSSLGLFVGWSLDKDSLVPVEGVADGSDITVYAIWTPAKRLNVWLQGKDEPIQLYIKEDGELIGELPFEYRKYDISEWFREEEREDSISLSYANVRADEDLYVSLLQTRKEVTLNPCNGEPEYTVLVGEGATVALPEWHGYEIEGWYLDRACDGERFELDFDSVSDGATYYAKWVRS